MPIRLYYLSFTSVSSFSAVVNHAQRLNGFVVVLLPLFLSFFHFFYFLSFPLNRFAHGPLPSPPSSNLLTLSSSVLKTEEWSSIETFLHVNQSTHRNTAEERHISLAWQLSYILILSPHILVDLWSVILSSDYVCISHLSHAYCMCAHFIT
jgi:hypothetical protein